MQRRTFLAASLAALSPANAFAQAAWPAQPIRLIVASAAGGNADVVARIVAQDLEARLQQRVLVENLPAASGMRATELVSRAAPDGYTLLLGTSSQLVHNIALFDPLPVDLTQTLRGVAMLNEVPMVLLVRADAPFNTPQELIAAAQARPGILTYGSGPVGTTTHITGLLFVQRGAIQVEHVPYQAGAQGIRDMIAGRITFQFDAAVTAVGHLAGGTVKALGVAAPERLAALPGVPTFAEVGIPGFLSGTWNSIAVPSATPEPVVVALNAAVAATMASPAIRSRLSDLGSFLPPPMRPVEVDQYYARERAVWIPIVRATGARAS